MKINYYYYCPNTGEFKFRSTFKNDLIELPYIEKPVGWRYCDYRVDVPYSTLIYQPYETPKFR